MEILNSILPTTYISIKSLHSTSWIDSSYSFLFDRTFNYGLSHICADINTTPENKTITYRNVVAIVNAYLTPAKRKIPENEVERRFVDFIDFPPDRYHELVERQHTLDGNLKLLLQRCLKVRLDTAISRADFVCCCVLYT